MEESKKKIRRMGVLLKSKTAVMEQESIRLNEIKQKKVEVVAEMKASQQAYLKSVQTLNNLRTSSQRQNLVVMESSLDHLKDKWTSLFKKVQQLESAEASQVSQLSLAHQDVLAVERMHSKYQLEHNKIRAKKEQDLVDSQGTERFAMNRERQVG